jgi:RNA polymerase sigma-70 factor, ECF subfamily
MYSHTKHANAAFRKEKQRANSPKKDAGGGEVPWMRRRHDRIVFGTGSPGGVNLDAPPFAVEEPGLEFFAFDASYVERLRSGDAYIEEHFVTYFSELIRLKLRSRLNSKEAIEDVRQETFMRVLALLRGDGGIRQPDRLGPFVSSVCNHVLLEHYRSKKRLEANIDDETAAAVAGREPSALSLLEAKDNERVVRQILNQLTERDRRLLQSVLLEERDKDEVCAEFGISREYLRVLVHRAKQSFKSFYINRLGDNRLH